MELRTLKEHLHEWTDVYAAQYHLSILLGITTSDSHPKWISWSNNPLGNLLYDTLESLVRVGILEKRNEPDLQYRWRADFNSANI